MAVPPDPIGELLNTVRNIAVVGLSNSPLRPSHGVALYLQQNGYHIIPVNPRIEASLGEKAYPSLADVPEKIDVVDVFRRPEFVPEIVEASIRKRAKVVWMQEGVIHEAAAHRAEQAGLVVVMDRCILKDHLRLAYAS